MDQDVVDQDQQQRQQTNVAVVEEASPLQVEDQKKNDEQPKEEEDLGVNVIISGQQNASEPTTTTVTENENNEPGKRRSIITIDERVPSSQETKAVLDLSDNKEEENQVVASDAPQNQVQTDKKRRRMRLSENHPLSKFVKDVLLPKFRLAASRMEDASESAWDRISQLEDKFSAKIEEFDRFRPWETMRILLGLLLMLFGHKFRVTFAIIEALRHGGSDEFMGNIHALQDQVHAIRAAHMEDNLVDENNDGIPDYLQISKRDLVKRKVRVAIKAIQPKVVQTAMQNLWTSFVSATATVKVESARRLSLGLSLGNDFRALLKRYVTPQLTSALDETSDYVTKWIPSVVDYLATFIGVIFAIVLSTHLAIITTSSRGALLMVTGVESILKAINASRQIREWEALVIYLVAFVASCFFQWFLAATAMHELNLVVQFVLLPFHSLETGLFTLVHLVKSDAEKFQSVLGKL